METTTNSTDTVKTQPKVYDHLFIAIFGKNTERSKRWRLELYNGATERDEDYELKLSDAFMNDDKSGKFEWTARVLNINKEYNLPLQKKCKPLYDYI